MFILIFFFLFWNLLLRQQQRIGRGEFFILFFLETHWKVAACLHVNVMSQSQSQSTYWTFFFFSFFSAGLFLSGLNSSRQPGGSRLMVLCGDSVVLPDSSYNIYHQTDGLMCVPTFESERAMARVIFSALSGSVEIYSGNLPTGNFVLFFIISPFFF